jgi:hypothetical protein
MTSWQDQEVENAKARIEAGEGNPVWDACVIALGYAPVTESEKRLWGRMVRSLKAADADAEKILKVAEWYQRHWPTVDLTLTAIEKWYSHFLAKAHQREKQTEQYEAARRVCPECGLGGGLHVEGCLVVRIKDHDVGINDVKFKRIKEFIDAYNGQLTGEQMEEQIRNIASNGSLNADIDIILSYAKTLRPE